MKDPRHFLTIWLVNSFIYYFTPLIMIELVVSGNARLTAFMASIISGFLLTLAYTATKPAFISLNIKLKDEWQWLTAYLFVNVLTVWVIARYADLTGVGIANAWIAVILGIIFTLAQWGINKYLLKSVIPN